MRRFGSTSRAPGRGRIGRFAQWSRGVGGGGGGRIAFNMAPTSSATTAATPVTLSWVSGPVFAAGGVLRVAGVATAHTLVDSHTVTFTTSPSGAAVAKPVTYTNPDLSSGTSVFYFLAPNALTCDPSVLSLAGGTYILINGLDIGTIASVSITDSASVTRACTSVTQHVDGSISCIAPAGAAGAATINLTQTDGVVGSGSVVTYSATVTFRSIDFTGATPGSLSGTTFTTTYGLTYGRASTATVQTAASTVQSGIAANRPRFINDGVSTQFLFEGATTNLLPNPRQVSLFAGLAGSATRTYAGINGPDGTSIGVGASEAPTRVQATAGQYANVQVLSGLTGPIGLSWWGKSTSAGAQSPDAYHSGQGFVYATGTNWAPFAFTDSSWPHSGNSGFTPVDTSQGGTAPVDVVNDLNQLEQGFPTSYTDTSRAAAQLYDAAGSTWLQSSQLRIAFQFIALGAPTEANGTAYLLEWGNGNALVDTSGTCSINIGGTTYTGRSGAVAWARGDLVDIFIEVINGVAEMGYRKTPSGGVASPCFTGVYTAATGAAPTIPGNLYFWCHAGAANSASGRYKRIDGYVAGASPPWFVPAASQPDEFDFTSAPLGKMTAATFASTYPYLTYSRASTAALQYGAPGPGGGWIDTTLAINDAGIGSWGLGWQGLQFHGFAKNLGRSIHSTVALGSGGANVTETVNYGSITSPDGTTSSTRVVRGTTAAEAYASYQSSVSGTTPILYSTFQRSTSGATITGAGQFIGGHGTDNYTATATWSRASRGAAGANWTPVSEAGGGTLFDICVDFFQAIDSGKFLTDPVLQTTGGSRAAPALSLSSVGPWLTAGSLGLELQYVPATNSENYAGATQYLAFLDANNYASFVPSTGVVTIAAAGTTTTFGTAIGWTNRLFPVDLFVTWGNGVPTLQYREWPTAASPAGAEVQTVVASTSLPAISASGGLNPLSRAATSTTDAWLKKFGRWPRAGQAVPAWALTAPLTSGAQTHAMVFDGDSITAGLGVTTSYPTRAGVLLGTGYGSPSNIGVSARTLATMRANGAANVDPLIAAGKTNVWSVFGGTNDLALAGTLPGALLSTAVGYITDRFAAVTGGSKWDVGIFATILPRTPAAAPFEAYRQAYLGLLTATFPCAAGSAWTALHAYALGAVVDAGNGLVAVCSVAGTSGAAAPTWSTTLSTIITDAGASWVMCPAPRKSSQAYATGASIYLGTLSTGPLSTTYLFAVATTGGTSASGAPTPPATFGQSYSDGSVTFRTTALTILRVDQDEMLGVGNASTDLLWYQSDQIHPTDAGAQRLASWWWTALSGV